MAPEKASFALSFCTCSPKIRRQSRWIKFPDNPLLPVPVVFVAEKGLRFPAAGEYLVQLTIDGQLITQRPLSIHQRA